MLQTGRFFQDPSLVSYVQLEVDEESDNNQLLVGGMNKLFRLDLDNFTLLETADWYSPVDKQDYCNIVYNPADCHNYIRVLLLQNSYVFACGTNSYSPMCQWRLANNLSVVLNSTDSRGLCPYSPSYNATAIISNDGDLYTATVFDTYGRDPLIIRSAGSSVSLRTMKHDSHWLNDPSFVSAFEMDNFVYFVFRETAVEYINCGKKVYSRVARVCKNDEGGQYRLAGIWTSFSKARINCSLPGEYPFYFDEVQSTFLSQDEKLIYAVFTTPPNSMAGSAVCVYDYESLKHAFNGPFKHKENLNSAWLKKENTNKKKCESNRSHRSSDKLKDLVTSTQELLMDRAVMPRELGPLIMRENERWSKIVVDHVIAKTGSHDVIFLSTDDGKIRKMMRHPTGKSTCLIEEIKIVPNGHPKPVQNMKISTEQGAIFVAVEGSVYRIPFQRCGRFTSSAACINAQDPYCGWNQKTNTCSPAPGGNVHDKSWEQNLVQCPILIYKVDGGWSDWSEWSSCPYAGEKKDIDRCQCRSRTCSKPAPSLNGRPCSGSSIQIVNCTVHGDWTAWSSWSACSQTCGFAVRKRTRQCGNPAPKFGGRSCHGTNTEESYCSNHPECPVIPIHGAWSDWAGWSTCTSNCNGGLQTRKRACDQPLPMKGGMPCTGNREEWRMCNTQTCAEISKLSPWTEWVQTNRTKGGYFQERFRFYCRANVQSSKDIKTSSADSQAQFCFKNDNSCFKPQEAPHPTISLEVGSNWERFINCFNNFVTLKMKNFICWKIFMLTSAVPRAVDVKKCSHTNETLAGEDNSMLSFVSLEPRVEIKLRLDVGAVYFIRHAKLFFSCTG
ncbi:semaphorin-5A [Biomphalaria glabrata]|nr:semaphorin-5A [Biomphalaria glabrata]